MTTVSSEQKQQLLHGLEAFLMALRTYTVAAMSNAYDDRWPAEFARSLNTTQLDAWNTQIREGKSPETLIDYQHLKSFSLAQKDVLRRTANKQVNSLSTLFELIYEVRNKVAHFEPIGIDDYNGGFINMKKVATILKIKALEKILDDFHQRTEATEPKKQAPHKASAMGLSPWYGLVQPQSDIQQGRLDESVFAANLAEVSAGGGREVYANADLFFQKTYFTAGLRNIAKRVVQGLNGGEVAENRVISLQTGFGGGKTHTLISLFHLAKAGKNALHNPFLKPLFEKIPALTVEKTQVAVFTNTTNDPTQGRWVENRFQLKTVWGELAYQLGGKSAYEIVRANDEQRTAPKGLFKKVLEMCRPALLLIDELADYCVSASGIPVGKSTLSDQTISFVQELTEAIAGVDGCVLIATLPASAREVADSEQAVQILGALENRMVRVGTNVKPVEEEEIFEVVRRRLFEPFDPTSPAIEQVISHYFHHYQQHLAEVPSYGVRSEYRDKLAKSYPFHPELIDIFRLRWASHAAFQRTRGVLRLLASIVADLWKRQNALTGQHYLIHTSDVMLHNLDALSSEITRLNGSSWDSVISADVAGSASNAARVDAQKQQEGVHYLAQGLATTILLGTFGSKGQNKGMGVDELKLCMVRPNGFNHNVINSRLDELEANAYYLYYSNTNPKRYWFETTPNINILINQAKQNIAQADIQAEITKRLVEQTKKVDLFHILVAPSEDIPEQHRPTLVILNSTHFTQRDELSPTTRQWIERIATKKGVNERIFRNTMLFAVCSEMGVAKLNEESRNYLACKKISDEYQSQLSVEQKSNLRGKIEAGHQAVNSALAKAYGKLVKYSVKNGVNLLHIKDFKDSLTAHLNNFAAILKEEEWLLDGIGLGTLRHNNLFPTVGQPIRVKNIYEAFLRFDDKPMITGAEAVSKSLLRYCDSGEYAIGSGSDTHFTRIYYKEPIRFFDVTKDDFWLVDKSLAIPPAPPPTVNEPTAPIAGTGLGLVAGASPMPSKGAVVNNNGVKVLKNIKITGKLTDKTLYTQLGSYFIVPFRDNNIEIEISIKIASNPKMTLDSTKQQYQSAKEAARQLGFTFEEE
jgi:Protein of unknown function (DUF499)